MKACRRVWHALPRADGQDCLEASSDGLAVALAATVAWSGGPAVMTVANAAFFDGDDVLVGQDIGSILIGADGGTQATFAGSIGCVGLAPAIHIVARDPDTLAVVASADVGGDVVLRPAGTEHMPQCDDTCSGCTCSASNGPATALAAPVPWSLNCARIQEPASHAHRSARLAGVPVRLRFGASRVDRCGV